MDVKVATPPYLRVALNGVDEAEDSPREDDVEREAVSGKEEKWKLGCYAFLLQGRVTGHLETYTDSPIFQKNTGIS